MIKKGFDIKSLDNFENKREIDEALDIDFGFNELSADNNKADLMKAIDERLFKNIDFVYNLTNNKFTSISRLTMKKESYIGPAFLAKLQAAYKNTFLTSNNFLLMLDTDNEKQFIQELKFFLPAVEEFTSFPNIKNGVQNIDAFETYNHFNHERKLVELRELASGCDKLKTLKEMNWKEFPEIELLLRFLTNEKENEAFDFNPDSGKYDIPVSLFEKMIHYLSALLNKTEKIGVSWTFQSPVQGVGKGVFFDYLISVILGRDFVGAMDSKTVLSGFNEEIDGKLFVMFNECKISKQADKETFNSKMKDWITEPNILIHRKHKSPEYKPNFCNFMIYTNEDVPYYIEKNCRRNIVVKTPHSRLDSAVKSILGITMDEFISRIEKQRAKFFFDLLRFDFNMSFVRLKAPITEAKRNIIQKTNTIASVVAELIKTNEIDDLKIFLEVNAEMDAEQIGIVSGEAEAGFLTSESTEILFDVFKGFAADDMNKTKKNVYFSNIFGQQAKIFWNDENGNKKEKRAFKLPHYTNEKVQAFYSYSLSEIDELKEGQGIGFNLQGFSF